MKKYNVIIVFDKNDEKSVVSDWLNKLKETK